VHVVPVWQRHIEAARQYSTDSMEQLVESFSSINQHLEPVLNKEAQPTQIAHHTEQIHDELERILVGLQSQDRVILKTAVLFPKSAAKRVLA
jgi:hypothetical protein